MSLKKLGRYDLIRVLGKGAMGIVYEGRDPNLDRRVAIKTVKVENLSEAAAAEYEARFRTEARSAARLQHPNIVSVYDSDRDGDIAFLVMEFIQGDDLKHHIDQGVRYSLEQSLKIIRDLLSALDYAHKQGIVHRDIKPANLLLEPGGRVKLTDFGVARIQDSGEATRTQGSMVGTLKYMSPEQVQGQKIDSRADLFSVGVVLYQLLTDKRPFDGDNDFSIIHQIIGHTPQPPSAYNARLPAAIDAVVARALAKDREQRFATARDFAVALQSAIRRAEDATVVPPADPFKKPADERAGAGGSRGTAGSVATSGTSVTSATSGSTATVTQELELVYWKDVKDSTDPEEIEMFLAKFPSGIYGELAQKRLMRLRAVNSSPDQTVLAGVTAGAAPPSDQDPDATRLLPDPLPVKAATSAEDPTRTLVESRDPGASVAETASVTASPQPSPPATAAPSTPPEAPPVAPAPVAAPLKKPGQKPQTLVVGGLACLVAVGAAAYFMTRGAGPATGGLPEPMAAASAPLDAASAPHTGASSPAMAGASSAAASEPAHASSPPSSHAAHPAPAKSVSKTPKAAPAPPPAPVVVAPAPVQAPSAPARETQPKAATPTAAAPQRAGSPNDACKDRIFLAREFCLKEQCDIPAFFSHPVCVQRRAEAKMREESKVRN
ncbi:MAG: protein kinase [Ramlibacter sp.]|nr:protein kinase [Ramlibacter sp.]